MALAAGTLTTYINCDLHGGSANTWNTNGHVMNHIAVTPAVAFAGRL